jgi:hypothetical protein
VNERWKKGKKEKEKADGRVGRKEKAKANGQRDSMRARHGVGQVLSWEPGSLRAWDQSLWLCA